MFNQKTTEPDIDEVLRKVELGNASDSVLAFMNDYIDTSIQRMMTQWVNKDVASIVSDAALINFHEAYRQAIKTHLLLRTRLHQNRAEGRAAEKDLRA